MMFSKSDCPYCEELKGFWKHKEIKYKAVELDQIQGGDKLHEQLIELTGRKTIPQSFVKGKHVGGCEDVIDMDVRCKMD